MAMHGVIQLVLAAGSLPGKSNDIERRLLNLMSPEVLVLGLLQYLVFLFSTSCHEASHALAAKLGGDLTAFQGGQVSLNPLPHVRREPFGMVIVPLLALVMGGYMIGWASAPYDPAWQQRYPRRAAWMSLAGPGANFALVLIAAILIHAGILAGVFQAPQHLTSFHVVDAAASGPFEALATLVSILFALNLILGVFNLLPIPPLDGFSALGIFMTESAAIRFERWGTEMRAYWFLGLLVGWQLFGRVYEPIFWAGIQLLYPGTTYR